MHPTGTEDLIEPKDLTEFVLNIFTKRGHSSVDDGLFPVGSPVGTNDGGQSGKNAISKKTRVHIIALGIV